MTQFTKYWKFSSLLHISNKFIPLLLDFDKFILSSCNFVKFTLFLSNIINFDQAASKLAEWCISKKSELMNKRILELGSGIGLTGLTVINTCFPKQYTFSDCHSAVLNLLCKNLATNLSTNFDHLDKNDERLQFAAKYKDTEVRAVDLKWEEMDKYLENVQEPEIVIAADVLYDNSNFSSLSSALETLLIRGCHYAIIAATVRNSETINQFLQQLGKLQLFYLGF